MDYRDRLAHGARERRQNENHEKMKVMVYREPDLVPYDECAPEVPYHEREGEVWVDAVYEICTGCGGRGKYVNPGIDSNGKGVVFGYDAIGSYDAVKYGVQGSGKCLAVTVLDNQLTGRN